MAKGFKIADAYVEVETRFDSDAIGREFAGAVERGSDGIERAGRDVGRRSGEAAGDEMGRATERRLRRDSRKNGRLISKAFFSDMAGAFGTGFIKTISLGFANAGSFSAFMKNPYIGTVGSAIAAALLASIAAGLSATLFATLGGVFGAGVIGLGAFLLKEDPDVRKAGRHLGDTFRRTFETAAGALRLPFIMAMNIFAKSIEKMQPTIDRIFRIMAPAIAPLALGLAGFMEALGPGLEDLAWIGADVLTDLGKNLPGWGKNISDFLAKVRENWPEIKESLEEFFEDTGTAIGVISAALLFLAQNYTTLKNILKGVILPPPVYFLISTLGLRWDDDWKKLTTKLNGWGKTVETFFRNLPGRAYTAVSSFWNRIRSAFTGAGLGMRISTAGMTQWVVTHLRGLPGRARAALGAMRTQVVAAFGGARTWLWGKGWDIVSGLASGIRSAAGSVLRWAVNAVADAIPDWIANRLGIRSPSTVMAKKVGLHIPSGIAMGAKEGMKQAKREMRGVAAGLPEAFAPKRRDYASVSNSSMNVKIDLKVYASAGADGKKIGREAAIEIEKALDELKVSRKR